MADLNELNTHSEESTEDPTYIEKMVAKADGAEDGELDLATLDETQEETVPDLEDAAEDAQPEWLPSKFKTPEELAKAYEQLEKKMGENPPDEREDLDPEAPLDFTGMSTEYWENGELPEARYAELESKGIPREIIASYLEGQQAIVSGIQQSVFTEVGGEQQYIQMMEWAQNNLSESEVAIYDNSVNSNSMENTLYAVKGLHARYASEAGVEPNLISGDGTSSTGSTYQSAAEVKADMSNPLYKTDPTFRATVAKRLRQSNVF
jgi:hypothetical protein